MEKMKRLSFFVLLILTCFGSQAQELTQTQKEELQIRVKNKVDEFQYYLNQLANKNFSMQTKRTAYDLALKLFIGEGENYNVYDPDMGRYVTKNAVRMETSSVNRTNKTRTLMKRYLWGLVENTRYTQIKIEDADIVRVDNIQKVGDHYECMAYFVQKYIGYIENRIAYSDITTKKVRVIVEAIPIERSDGTTQIIWNALLGDVYVTETRRI